LVIGSSPLVVSSRTPPLDGIARVVPEDPLELLGRQPATEPPPRVLLGFIEEGGAGSGVRGAPDRLKPPGL